MQIQHEKWLTERLREGIPVKDVYPYVFENSYAYYKLFFIDKKMRVMFEVQRENVRKNTEIITLQITKIIWVINKEKVEDVKSKLLGKTLTLLKPESFVDNQKHYQIALTGKIVLQ